MQKLKSLLRRYAEDPHRAARWWIGERPAADTGEIWKEIAGYIGYPSLPVYLGGGLTSLRLSQAAHVLAVAGTTSLAYDKWSPTAADVLQAEDALGEFDAGATFLSNGLWEAGPSSSWDPLTNATFDCGVIGYNDRNAFVFWIEEED
ncbi:hypothetical protein [Devosia sp. A16]|uniref:hypothetical protein n=1 Tax=Devosia sp. A16 TaxID=1736675 RepID=UPI0006D77F05|nr:hypothetical protein [Devosia sp. A16]